MQSMLRSYGKYFGAAFALLLGSSAIASATPIFQSDTEYQIIGSMSLGPWGKLTFSDASTLYYDSTSQKLKVDIEATSNTIKNTTFDLDVVFGAMSLKNGAFDTDPGSEYDVNFPKSSSQASFTTGDGMVKNGEHMIGTLSSDTAYNLYNVLEVPAGYDAPVFATGDMSPDIKADSKNLFFDAWIRVWGDGPFIKDSQILYHYDQPADIHATLVARGPHTDVPEPMTVSLLATGLLGGALSRRRRSGC